MVDAKSQQKKGYQPTPASPSSRAPLENEATKAISRESDRLLAVMGIAVILRYIQTASISHRVLSDE